MIEKTSAIGADFVVGVGASAGGLEAIHELFDNIPSDTGLCYIVVQHLSPDYKSLLPDLLAKHTTMPVYEAADGMRLEKNSVYVMPSKKLLEVDGKKIVLLNKNRNQFLNTAIDSFFTSLALNFRDRCAGIILSGTGSDGSKGIQEIKRNGGIVIVQDPQTAKFDGMPNSAIETEAVDLVLPPELIGEELKDLKLTGSTLKSFKDFDDHEAAIVDDIIYSIRRVTGYDFSFYKRPTIHRRLIKRMTQKGIVSLNSYHDIISENPDEVKLLCKEFLIGVTRFFRDPEAFQELELQTIPSLVNKLPETGGTLKIWSIACSTGEEAYSLAILFVEALERSGKSNTSLKIFATDIDQDALDYASKGIYPETIKKDISKERLEKFFIPEGSNYRIAPALRKLIVFAHHDITKDPPFSKLDLVSCRNMLIYMNSDLQKKVLRTIHFALNIGGYMLLGPSENAGDLKDFVSEKNKKWKIFQSLDKGKFNESGNSFNYHSSNFMQSGKLKNAVNHIPDVFLETMLEDSNFAGIYITKELEIKHAVGNFKRFLRFPDGALSFNLQKMVHSDLSIAISSGVRKAIKENTRVSIKNIKLNESDRFTFVNLTIKPFLQQNEYQQPFLFIVLEEASHSVTQFRDKSLQNENIDGREIIAELEKELRETRENLKTVVEELEASNEELQSSNEEMISANEEMQSTNEELQSLNEELHTVNAEHQLKIRELIELNDDLNNYFRNSPIGQIVLDHDYRIRRFSPIVKQQINLQDSDIGRQISDISNNFTNVDLLKKLKIVSETGKPIEREVTLKNGSFYKMSITPYIKQDKTYEGIVITFVDITALKQLNSLISGIVESTMNGIMAFKSVRNKANELIDLEWISANRQAEIIFGVTEHYFIGKRLLFEFPQTDQSLFRQYVDVIETGDSLKTDYLNSETGKWFNIVAVKMQDGIVVTFVDITDKKNAEILLSQNYEHMKTIADNLSHSNVELSQTNNDLMQFASIVSHDLKEPLRKILTFGNLLQTKFPEKLNAGGFEYINKIIRSSERMKQLIDELTTFSRVSNNTENLQDVSLKETCMKIIDDLEVTINERCATVKIDDNLPVIKAFPVQIQQLFLNLISNALKFNESEKPEIHITGRNVSPEERVMYMLDPELYTAVEVRDNGIGINTEDQEKIFEIFKRLHTSSEYEGTGIGLAICKKVVENIHGYISVKSKIGEGSRFILLLPYNASELTQKKPSGEKMTSN